MTLFSPQTRWSCKNSCRSNASPNMSLYAQHEPMSIQHESQREPVEYSSWWAYFRWVRSGKYISCCLFTFPPHWATNRSAVSSGILALQFHFFTFIIVAEFGNLSNLVQPRLHRLCGPIQDQLIESKVIINLFRCLSYLSYLQS